MEQYKEPTGDKDSTAMSETTAQSSELPSTMPQLENYEARIEELIQADFRMISVSPDQLTKADAQNISRFQLADPAGRAGGTCTSALLKVLHPNGTEAGNISWADCLRRMRTEVQHMGLNQVPQLTSSRLIDVDQTMHIVPPEATGKKRALLIGINYVGQQGQLSSCHDDVNNIKKYLIEVHHFPETEMLILMDDGKHSPPTRKNIEDAFERIAQDSQADDVVFVHYSGHGSRIYNYTGVKRDGSFETLVPVDFKKAGHVADSIVMKLVKPMKAGVTVIVLMDCCRSETVLHLPYRCLPDDSKMQVDQNVPNYMVKADESVPIHGENEPAADLCPLLCNLALCICQCCCFLMFV